MKIHIRWRHRKPHHHPDPMVLLRQVANRLWEQAPGGDQDAPVTRQELVEALLEADAFLEQEMDLQT